ncbi:MAG TPA: hypothetical protein VFU56_01770 [Gaiellaceae bacterium]|nr:hypothetical protein [Gaiellaceae bacterium]
MRRVLPLLAVALCLTACGGSGEPSALTTTAAAPTAPLPSFEQARARTLAAGSVRVVQTTALVLSGTRVEAHDRGSLSLDGRRAHLYRLSPGQSVPGEVIVDGPIIYSNANVQAAMSSPEVKPWTRLDRRKLTAEEKAQHPDEVGHAVTPLYLAFGARAVKLDRRVADGALYWARVDPSLVEQRVPSARRTLVAGALRADYPRADFNAKFWVDGKGRIRRVIVAYATPKGTPVAVDTSYDSFGTKVDVTPPPARSTKDITPAR